MEEVCDGCCVDGVYAGGFADGDAGAGEGYASEGVGGAVYGVCCNVVGGF